MVKICWVWKKPWAGVVGLCLSSPLSSTFLLFSASREGQQSWGKLWGTSPVRSEGESPSLEGFKIHVDVAFGTWGSAEGRVGLGDLRGFFQLK